MLTAGADGCGRGWICLLREESAHISSRCFETADALLNQVPRPRVLALDIPIGLPDEGPRECDRLARALLGPRRASSVFPAPLRSVLEATSWEQACALRERVEGRRMSRQAWALVPKIAEVDRALRGERATHGRVREVHPELCFRAWRGRSLAHRKRDPRGREERLQLVAGEFGPDAFQEVRARYRRRDVADHDILDAFAALWTAERILRGNAKTLPAHPPVDSHGLEMEIVY